MKNLLTKKCPICSSEKQKTILDLDCGNVDNSPLFPHAIIKSCTKCGHIFNELSDNDFKGLIKYYNEEYVLTNLSAPDKDGDRPGSSNKYSKIRFNQLYECAKDYLNSGSKVLDIGCAMGGFLSFLKNKNIKQLYGIDFTENYVTHVQKHTDLKVKIGNAEEIPYENDMFDILFMDQVLEHLINPRQAFSEARRVLKDGGYYCIGVPNAFGYDENYIFDFFWFLMREHIQHFDMHHLKLVAQSEGFEVVCYKEGKTPMMNESMLLPQLTMLFKKSNKSIPLEISKISNKLVKYIEKYIESDMRKLNKKQIFIKELKDKNIPIYIWGIGREYLYLKQNTEIDKCNIVNIIDGNQYKREFIKINGHLISEPNILAKASNNSFLIITAASHIKNIKELALEIGFSGKIIEI